MIAEVAELVDALGSGSSRWTPVGVRVPSSAPRIEKRVSFQQLARFHFGLVADGCVESSRFTASRLLFGIRWP